MDLRSSGGSGGMSTIRNEGKRSSPAVTSGELAIRSDGAGSRVPGLRCIYNIAEDPGKDQCLLCGEPSERK